MFLCDLVSCDFRTRFANEVTVGDIFEAQLAWHFIQMPNDHNWNAVRNWHYGMFLQRAALAMETLAIELKLDSTAIKQAGLTCLFSFVF